MFGYLRTRPLMFAAACTATAVLIGFLALLLVVALSMKPLTPQRVLAEALAMDQDPRNPRKLLDPPNWRPGVETLRGLTRLEAEQIRAACRTVGDWIFVGDEVGAHDDCLEDDCSGAALMSCETTTGSLIARLWMEGQKVDHLADLALNSEFLACRTGQCPDFAVGEPTANGYDRGTHFKTAGRVTKQ